jgi:hypothetical protein
VRGVLLWDIWDQVESARNLIAAPDSIHSSPTMAEIASVH